MKALIVTIGNRNVPSSRVRALQYIPYLEEAGISCKHITYRKGYYLKFKSKSLGKSFPLSFCFRFLSIAFKLLDYLIFSKLAMIKVWWSSGLYDLIFIQKVVLPVFVIKHIRRRSRYIFDFDDAIYSQSHFFSLRQFRNQLRYSELTLVTNEEARKYAQKSGAKQVKIIVGPIDSERYKSKVLAGSGEKFNIGWIGSSSTFKYLDLIREAMIQLSEKYPGQICLHLIGAGDVKMEGIETNTYSWSLDTELSILNTFDVGVMPLTDDEFSRGKGGYKLLQYMSMAKGNVSSPVGVNRELVVEGQSGFFADNTKQWVQCLENYYLNRSLCRMHGEKARELILKNYSLLKWSSFLLEYFNVATKKNVE